MSFEGSYLWKLRQEVGHDLVLIPGAAVAAQREDGRVLFIRRGDNGVWALPGGAAEEGGSFARTAVDELREETGLLPLPPPPPPCPGPRAPSPGAPPTPPSTIRTATSHTTFRSVSSSGAGRASR